MFFWRQILPIRCSCRRRRRILDRLAFVVLGVALNLSAAAADPRGLPFIRTYPLDEIGNVPRNLRLGFDSFGRIAVMYDGIYLALNDTTWVNRMDRASATRTRMTTIKYSGGTYYYGGRGSWGRVDTTPEGRFRAHPFVPPDAPAWASVAALSQILFAGNSVYFYDYNGVIVWNFARKKNSFFPMPLVSTVFHLGERVFVSCQDGQLREILQEPQETRILTDPSFGRTVVTAAAALDSTSLLLALGDGRLVRFDGHSMTPWAPQTRYGIGQRILALESLVEGGVAISVSGEGIYLVAPDGELRWSLGLPEFQQISAMAAGEPGVLWATSENAVHRIFYDSPLTSFGQQLGLSALWPKIMYWAGKYVVCSNKNLYVLKPAAPGNPARFDAQTDVPVTGADTGAASGTHLLAGNATGVYAKETGGAFVPVIKLENVAGMDFVGPDTCVVIGAKEIAVLHYADGRWSETVPRARGVGEAPIRTSLHGRALWIEMGADRIGRLTLHDGKIDLQRIPVPWSEAQWTNVGTVGDVVVLSGSVGQRVYYNDRTETFCEDPALDGLLNRSPQWIARMTVDATGTLWATHAQGVVTLTPVANDYAVDASTYDLRNDSYPAIARLPDGNVWVTTGRSLYHVEKRPTPEVRRPRVVLVSMVADNQNVEKLSLSGALPPSPQLAFDDNSLSFRIFSGTYAWRFPPLYEYRLSSAEPWTPVDPNLLLRFPKLRDGSYFLEVRPADPHGDGSPPLSLAFAIKPPWFRTPLSFTLYAFVVVLLVIVAARWLNHRSLRRNAALERLVLERTSQLEETMGKLGEETRTTAVLAERSRLANELHDSIQQGLSGSILQLDTTMSHTTIPPDVHSRLTIVRKMLSFTREEVQQAVWNLESPLLHNASLGEALRKIVSLLHDGSRAIHINVGAESAPLGPAVQHNLLRIAQEAITNAVKHANASRIDVTLATPPDAIVLTIADDGCGFDPPQRATLNGHFGLRGIAGRAKSIGAVLAVNSSPGQGTTIRVALPRPTLSSHDARSQNQPT
jgi:signal transduction histidine kinase